MYECFHCGEMAVLWLGDFTFEDCGYEGDGIVHICECTNCGAEIEYRIPIPDEPVTSTKDGYEVDFYWGEHDEN